MKASRYRNKNLLKYPQVFLIAAPGGHRNIYRSPLAFSSPYLIDAATPWVKGILVGGEVENTGVFIKGVLGTIAMMNVEVHDKDTLKLVAIYGMPGGNGYVIE